MNKQLTASKVKLSTKLQLRSGGLIFKVIKDCGEYYLVKATYSKWKIYKDELYLYNIVE